MLLGAIYVSQTWSPSSYGLVLRNLEAKNTGLVIGDPKPIRADEWAVITSLTAASVNNHFERYNKTSPYNDDLRIAFGIPIDDWGWFFKPTMMLYKFVNPAYAFSFHYFSVFALFIAGYTVLFLVTGATRTQAVLLAFCAYLTAYSQFWWTDKGVLFSLYGAAMAVLFLRMPKWIRLLLFYWLLTGMMIEMFYPPYIVSLAFVSVAFVLAYGREWLRPVPLIGLAVAAGAAAATTGLYLKDYLLATMKTLYPGGRSVMGGGVGLRQAASQLFPFATFDGRLHELLPNSNICESATFGVFFVLLALCFANYRNLTTLVKDRIFVRRALILGAALAMMLAWELLPVPESVGKLLLWNNVQPSRMQYAQGVLLLFFVVHVVSRLGLSISPPRIVTFVAIVVFGWMMLKARAEVPFWPNSIDLLIIPFAIAAYLVARYTKIDPAVPMLVASVITAALVIGRFNPLQQAWPIFNREDTPVIAKIRAAVDPKTGYLVQQFLPESVQNGLGFKSISYTTAIPQWHFWNQFRDKVDAQTFNTIFNRYSNIWVTNDSFPAQVAPDAIRVPATWFHDPDHRVEAP
ncbi:hypothetical protein LMG27174_05826 [Paraburkholderia rhynchosiae]|uniref:DUF7657 domain-containing protein n=1 Tax=Paraburkholderia rhynchosiae TaxID=487049 RepID=A0A6J5C9H4_9BURK|nr:hypothetical protein [Paraburkholderia rhynchosiae]CAB3731320.1 hypothetical protein LMG27174_05826 [Paraburkholderia rhynchosiae]